jgi:hypothetical protein
MATQLKISQDEYQKLRALGMSKEQIIQKYSNTQPSRFQKATTGIANTFAKGATDFIGTNVAQITNAASALRKDTTVEQALARSKEIGDANDPSNLKRAVGTGAQLGSIAAGGIKNAATGLTRFAGNVAMGAGAFGGQAAAENRSASTIAKQAAVGGAFGGALDIAAQGIEKVGKGIYKAIIPKNKQEAGLLQSYQANNSFRKRIQAALLGQAKPPRTTADTAFDKGLIGTESMLGVQAKRAQKNIWDKLIAPDLKADKTPIQLSGFFQNVRNQIITKNPELTRQKSLLTALDAVADDYKGKPTVSLEELQELKKGFAKFVPEKVYRGENIAGALGELRHLLASEARTTIHSRLGGDVARRAFIDYGNLENLAELGQSAMTGGRLKGGFGSFWSAIAEQVLTPFATVGGQTVYKVGNGIELIGRPGLNTVGQFLLDLTSEDDQQSTPPAKGPQSQVPTSSTNTITTEKNKLGGTVEDGVYKQPSPFSDGNIEIDLEGGGAGTVAGGAKKLVSTILKKVQPSDIARIGDFLRRFERTELNNQMSLMDNYAGFFKKLGVDDLAPDDLVKVLDDIMMRSD